MNIKRNLDETLGSLKNTINQGVSGRGGLQSMVVGVGLCLCDLIRYIREEGGNVKVEFIDDYACIDINKIVMRDLNDILDMEWFDDDEDELKDAIRTVLRIAYSVPEGAL